MNLPLWKSGWDVPELTSRPYPSYDAGPLEGAIIAEESELIAALKPNTDLARLVDRVARANLPRVVVSPVAVVAWEREDPAGWAKVSHWLALKGVAVVRI